MKEICLSQGLSTTVDDDKYDWLVSFGKWYARKSSHTFYAQRNIRLYKNRKILQMHRLIINAQPGQIVDHINQNALDNRKDNLRIVTQSENVRNNKWSFGVSGYYGVSKDRKHYRAIIHGIRIGSYLTPEEAARAYDRKSIEIGRTDKLNFPEEYHAR